MLAYERTEYRQRKASASACQAEIRRAYLDAELGSTLAITSAAVV